MVINKSHDSEWSRFCVVFDLQLIHCYEFVNYGGVSYGPAR